MASEDNFIDISLVEPLPGQNFWDRSDFAENNSTSNFINLSSKSARDLQKDQMSYDALTKGKYTDRFTMGESSYGDEFMLHSNKYLANKRNSSSLYKIENGAACFCVDWHPKRALLAYTCDDSDHSRKEEHNGNVRLFGIDC